MKILETYHITILTVATSFCLIWSVIAFWELKFPEKSPEQQRLDSYFRCVITQNANGRDIGQCNLIK